MEEGGELGEFQSNLRRKEVQDTRVDSVDRTSVRGRVEEVVDPWSGTYPMSVSQDVGVFGRIPDHVVSTSHSHRNLRSGRDRNRRGVFKSYLDRG